MMEMHELLPNFLPRPVKFQSVSIETLDKASNSNNVALGNILKSDDLAWAWTSQGSCLEVVNSYTGQRIGSWCFGAVMKELNVTITCVVEICYGWETLLLVGLQSRGAGMLCTFNPMKSKLLSAIDLPSKVVSLEVIFDSLEGSEVLIGYLQLFNGLVAVGMASGLVYLVDLCLDKRLSSNETQTAKVYVIPASTPDINSIRDSLDDLEHLAIVLDAECCARGSYYFHRPDGKTMQSFHSEDVCVTSMKYIPQIGSLIVGMNFGCFQVWKMDQLMLEYSSPYETDLAPITHFVYQEPENDPKKFVYLWIGRGPTFVDRRDGDCSALSLYQLSYDVKKILHNHGVLYRNLQSVIHRFEHPLTSDPYNVNGLDNVAGSTLISCDVITDAVYQRVAKREDGIDEHVNDLSLCAFLWDAVTDVQSEKPTYLLGLFDLNRWYHAQMPSSVKPSQLSHGVCPYFAFCNLEDVVETTGSECILAARICKDSVTRYKSIIMPAPEQHFYPSALAFDICCLLERSTVRLRFSGVQKQILSDLRRNNTASLVEPTVTFKNCASAEILPKFIDGSVEMSLPEQRENILSICIENGMVDVVLNCINNWADGEFSRSGCTLRLILSAAWSRVVKTKELIDKTCVPLFDCSVTGVDRQTVRLLHQHETELGRLARVFQQLLNLAATTTEQGAYDMQVKLNVTNLLHEYMRVLTWLMVVGLLPETIEGDMTSNKYNYPATSLSQAFTIRRQDLNRLHADVNLTDVLMIDGLINHIGSQVKDLWNKVGGNGLYPPPSLHGLLGIYLLDNVPITAKHCVLAYLILDLISLLPDSRDEKLVQECSLFAQCFGLTPSVARLVQGFWLLDHNDFTEAVHVLLDPIIANSDLLPWQHTRIIKAFLYQGEAKAALRYLNARHRNISSPEDIKLKLTVLLASDHINQAFEYQRACRDRYNNQDMLEHFFAGCLQTRNVGHLLALPLDDFEEQNLVEFLLGETHPQCQELLVMYYLRRARYVDAIRLQEKLKKSKTVDTNPDVQRRAIAREAIINGYLKNLPEVQRAFITPKLSQATRSVPSRIEVDRPQPLSTVVFSKSRKMNSQASLIFAVMEKVKEVQRFVDEGEESRDEEPVHAFVGLPSTPRHKRTTNTSGFAISSPEKADNVLLRKAPFSPQGAKSPLSKLSDSDRRRMQKYPHAEAMALLATPPVKRIHSVRIKAMATPQSILKVRNTVRNNSPFRVKNPATTTETSDSLTARRNPFVSISGSQHAPKPGTPKLLRFVLSPSRSNTQLKNEENKALPQGAVASGDENDGFMSQVVDEEITFNFSVSRLNDIHDKMDTEHSCPSTPSVTEGQTTPDLSPDKCPELVFSTPSSGTRRDAARLVPSARAHAMDVSDDFSDALAQGDFIEKNELISMELMEAEAEERIQSHGDNKAKDSAHKLVSGEEICGAPESQPYEVAKTMLASLRAQLTPRSAKTAEKSSPVEERSRVYSPTDSRPQPEDVDEANESDEVVVEVHDDEEEDDVSESEDTDSSIGGSAMLLRSADPPDSRTMRIQLHEDSPKTSTNLKKSSLTPTVGAKTPESFKAHKPSPVIDVAAERDVDESTERSPVPPASPRRSPRLAKKASPSKVSPSTVRPQDESPLSSGSFMMKHRQTSRGSRDTTPDRAMSPDEPIHFTFSDPVSQHSDEALSAGSSGQGTTPRPFIFSPPVTRSRRRRDPESVRSLLSSILDPNQSVNTSGLLDVSVSDPGLVSMADQSSVFDTSQTTKSTKKTRRKVAVDESCSDSPINFVSPLSTRESTKSASDSRSTLPYKMTLRSRFRVGRPERKSVKLLKD